MTFTATVKNGSIQLPEGMHFPDGTHVIVEPVEAPDGLEKDFLGRRLGRFVGIADDLPSDLARNIDHYVHGHPKRP